MKRFSFLSLLLLLTGCQLESPIQLAPDSSTRSEPAYIWGNSLAGDGCEEYVQPIAELGSSTFVAYKPTPSTLPLLQRALSVIPVDPTTGRRPVVVRFRLTGRQVSLRCGWGARPSVPELEILSITPP